LYQIYNINQTTEMASLQLLNTTNLLKYFYNKRLIVTLLVWTLILSCHLINGQTTISGAVTDKSGSPVPYANIVIENTLDGTISDEMGKFRLSTAEKGRHNLVVTCIGFKGIHMIADLNNTMIETEIKLEESNLSIDEVVVTAGAYEANNDRKVALLRPLDIYTNSSAGGDIVGAIQTLPGTQKVSQETGLFVRGGDASESSVIIDGLVVQNPFFSNVPGVSQRSRFSPFQFKGISFSSGGYGARYGQALSSILELNTNDLPEITNLNFNVSMSGLAIAGAQRWSNSGLEITGNYTNLWPFYSLVKTNYDVYKIPEGGGISARYSTRVKKNGFFKTYVKYDGYGNGLTIPNPDSAGRDINYSLKNRNLYVNSSYRYTTEKMYVYTAISYSKNKDDISWSYLDAGNDDWRAQWRGEAGFTLSDHINLLAGSELQRFKVKNVFDTIRHEFDEFQPAAYLEAEWKPCRIFAIKPGVRFQRSQVLNENSVAPRLAFALKTGKNSQVSLAGGFYYQNPDNKYLLYGYRPEFQKAVHYIANYQWIKNDRSLRIETYYKQYGSLIRELTVSDSVYNPNPYRYIYGLVDNSGNGYATGIDFFWRDKATIKYFDYWISYSYIDTKRLYSNLKESTTPDFISNHNLNILLKYFIEAWGVNLSTSYNYASGRPYYNPADADFMSSRTNSIKNISLSISYIATFGKWFTVFYASVENVFNWKNIYGYRYSENGQNRYEIRPAIDRSIFVGASISLTPFSKDEL
jgi:hypothetical protein